jgi:hypothetical protein
VRAIFFEQRLGPLRVDVAVHNLGAILNANYIAVGEGLSKSEEVEGFHTCKID